MNAAGSLHTDNPLKALSRSINQPAITLAAVVLALVLGALRLPFLQHLRPVGDFYIALLQICVLPFLLATIPLAMRSAMASGSAPGVIRSLLFWVLVTLLAVAAVSTIIPSLFFNYSSPNEQMLSHIGALLGRSADTIDIEFAIDPRHATEIKEASDFGIFALIPTNIFASLSSNDSVRVLVFAQGGREQTIDFRFKPGERAASREGLIEVRGAGILIASESVHGIGTPGWRLIGFAP